MPKETPQIAVLVPTYDELGSTVDRSLYNIALRTQEVPHASFAVFVGVNGTDKQEEVARVQKLADSWSNEFADTPVTVCHYATKGKERAMNGLAKAASEHFGGQGADMHIGTDIKVYRTPGSFKTLIDEFSPALKQNSNPRYIGATILPYPIQIYEQYFPLNPEQRLFYTLLEIDKDAAVRSLFPKSHLRGGLYITGPWRQLTPDIADDFTITRKTRAEYGPDGVQLSDKAQGYVIPRQSFADYFAVRLKRVLPIEKTISEKLPDLNKGKDIPLPDEEQKQRLQALRKISPEKHALFMTKKALDQNVIFLANMINDPGEQLDTIQNKVLHSALGVPANMDLDTVTHYALYDPQLAAYSIINHYRTIIEALSIDPHSIEYGPREERYRGMLPLDYHPKIPEQSSVQSSSLL